LVDILIGTFRRLSRDNISVLSAGVSFYLFISMFPGFAALVSLYGLVANPRDVDQLLRPLSSLLPQEALRFIGVQLARISRGRHLALNVGAISGLVLTIWSARTGVRSLLLALNIAFDERERRGFIKLNATAIAFVLSGLILGVLALALVVAIPIVIGALDLPVRLRALVFLLRWPILSLMLMGILAVIYRYGPSRVHARWRWVTWGSVAATLLWLTGSIAFSIYVANFGHYDKVYGTVAAAVILLLWLDLFAFSVLFGAELDAEKEHPRPLTFIDM
jgi:membrane protein